MYTKSEQAKQAPQTVATAKAVALWGSGPPGHEVIAHTVCKGKYVPWKNGEQQFGCFRHHDQRKKNIAKAGVREGWECFDQWPLKRGRDDDREAGSSSDGKVDGDQRQKRRKPSIVTKGDG